MWLELKGLALIGKILVEMVVNLKLCDLQPNVSFIMNLQLNMILIIIKEKLIG
jgi:hypothetical protein